MHAEPRLKLDVDYDDGSDNHVRKAKQFDDGFIETVRKAFKLRDDAHIPFESINNAKGEFHTQMDAALREREAELRVHLARGGTNVFLRISFETIENTFIEFCDISPECLNQFSGRGRVEMMHRKSPMLVIDDITKTLQPTSLHAATNRILREHRRCDQAASVLRLINGGRGTRGQNCKWEVSLQRHLKAFLLDIDPDDQVELELCEKVHGVDASNPAAILLLCKHINKYNNR